MSDPTLARGVARLSRKAETNLKFSAQMHASWLIGMAVAIALLRAILAHFRAASLLVWLVLGTLTLCSLACEFTNAPNFERMVKLAAIGAYGAKPLLSLFLSILPR